jgi:hypothetical protein
MSNTIMKTLTTLVAWAFYLGLSFCFMRAWVQVTPGGIAWLVAGLAVSGVMCALVARS